MDFSVIVPTYNRPVELAGCLEALRRLDYPQSAYEIIIADDGGSADLSTAAGRAGALLLRQSHQGPGAARNLAARHARGRWLAFTDDDCRPDRGWLTDLRRTLEEGEDLLIGGTTFNRLADNVYACTSQLISDAAYRHFNPDPARGRFLASNNMAVWRAPFLEAGGFDERFRYASEDRELCDRWVWRGGRIVWTPDALVAHGHALTLPRFLRQHFNYGRGAARFHRLRSIRGSGSLRGDTSFHWNFGSLVLAPALASHRPAATLALIACWQAANTAGFLVGTIKGMSPRS